MTILHVSDQENGTPATRRRPKDWASLRFSVVAKEQVVWERQETQYSSDRDEHYNTLCDVL